VLGVLFADYLKEGCMKAFVWFSTLAAVALSAALEEFPLPKAQSLS
jgi:hypothetical protein